MVIFSTKWSECSQQVDVSFVLMVKTDRIIVVGVELAIAMFTLCIAIFVSEFIVKGCVLVSLSAGPG